MRTFALATSLFLAALPAAAQDKATIEKLNAAFQAAFNKGDFGAVGGMYTEDAYLLPSGSPMMQGRGNVQAFWAEAGKSVSEVKLTTIDVQPLGPEAAREVGRFSLKLQGAPAKEVSGKYVVVWRKIGNDWKLATDIWNSDQ